MCCSAREGRGAFLAHEEGRQGAITASFSASPARHPGVPPTRPGRAPASPRSRRLGLPAALRADPGAAAAAWPARAPRERRPVGIPGILGLGNGGISSPASGFQAAGGGTLALDQEAEVNANGTIKVPAVT
ncbi:Hypothetical predicted protein [Podarcis lilfordi]|uniref:Uncharacterized protein n=1 Tax=Podarcis lilfordi TaxID=74358 RepID=A0AA35KFA3_9SAUR|nr:Hypothetical predicted protein [Podarcis lilfordi]